MSRFAWETTKKAGCTHQGFIQDFLLEGGNNQSKVTQCGNNNALGGVGPENSMEIYVLCLLVTSVVITNI